MNRSAQLVASTALMMILCGGCASRQTTPRVSVMPTANTVSLATLEPTRTPSRTTQAKSFHLGAGDSLGQAIYANYATIARANAGWQYASGSTLE